MSEKDFLTVHDIAQELGLTARTVRRLFSIGKAKKLPGNTSLPAKHSKSLSMTDKTPAPMGAGVFPLQGVYIWKGIPQPLKGFIHCGIGVNIGFAVDF